MGVLGGTINHNAGSDDRESGNLGDGDEVRRSGRVLALLLIVLVTAPACQASEETSGAGRRPATASADELLNAVTWGCEQAIPSTVRTLDPSWREEAIVVGDLGFDVTSGSSGYRRHEDAAIEVKLPILIEGHVAVTVSVPDDERGRVALILSNVPRRGPGNSYRIEDGHQAVRFEPCADRSWSAWTAGLALADPRSVVVNVDAADATESASVKLGPWEVSHRMRRDG
jgi:hypothetical protein